MSGASSAKSTLARQSIKEKQTGDEQERWREKKEKQTWTSLARLGGRLSLRFLPRFVIGEQRERTADWDATYLARRHEEMGDVEESDGGELKEGEPGGTLAEDGGRRRVHRSVTVGLYVPTH